MPGCVSCCPLTVHVDAYEQDTRMNLFNFRWCHLCSPVSMSCSTFVNGWRVHNVAFGVFKHSFHYFAVDRNVEHQLMKLLLNLPEPFMYVCIPQVRIMKMWREEDAEFTISDTNPDQLTLSLAEGGAWIKVRVSFPHGDAPQSRRMARAAVSRSPHDCSFRRVVGLMLKVQAASLL